MKALAYNSLLVFALSFLFALPFLGFNFIKYEPAAKPVVLGVENAMASVPSPETPVNVVAQFDYEVNIPGAQGRHKLYDVLPTDYIEADYQFVIVFPNDMKEIGVTASIAENAMTADLVFEVGEDLGKALKFPASIVVVSR